MKAIILATAAVLTLGTAPAVAQIQTYDTGTATMTTSKEGCVVEWRESTDRVIVNPGGTQIDSGGTSVIITPDGKIASLNSPFPGAEEAELLVQMAHRAREACANGTRAMELEQAQ